MKKSIALILIMSITVCLFSCQDRSIIDKKGVVWKEDFFYIVATSEELRYTYYGAPEGVTENECYNSISFRGQEEMCLMLLEGKKFALYLIDKETLEYVYFFGDSEYFLWGRYGKLVKEKGKPYKYSLTIKLTESGQYYEYCMANGLEFPEYITLYGYEDKAQ